MRREWEVDKGSEREGKQRRKGEGFASVKMTKDFAD